MQIELVLTLLMLYIKCIFSFLYFCVKLSVHELSKAGVSISFIFQSSLWFFFLEFSLHDSRFNVLMSFSLHHFMMQIHVSRINIQHFVDLIMHFLVIGDYPCFTEDPLIIDL